MKKLLIAGLLATSAVTVQAQTASTTETPSAMFEGKSITQIFSEAKVDNSIDVAAVVLELIALHPEDAEAIITAAIASNPDLASEIVAAGVTANVDLAGDIVAAAVAAGADVDAVTIAAITAGADAGVVSEATAAGRRGNNAPGNNFAPGRTVQMPTQPGLGGGSGGGGGTISGN